jgi:glyoxylase-like metal-dependent hydrolase (beta-lactamase superfamily II)
VWIGDIEVRPVSDGTFRLDGGAMFGTVPKTLWERRAPADPRNRIQLGLNALFIRVGQTRILVDAGMGNKLSPREMDLFGVERTRHLDRSLADIGVASGDIDLVIATHLHLDHAGGFTHVVDGVAVPRFVRARYLVRHGEWEDAMHPHERNRASYLAEDFEPLARAGVVDFLYEDTEVAPGVSVWRTGGHTAHHQIVRIDSCGRTALFMADLVPTAAHIDLAWIMGYDLYPVETLAAKKRWVAEAIAGEYVIFFEHDPAIQAGVIRLESGRKCVDALLV